VKALHENMQGLANDGRPARLITLCNASGMTATFMDLGATWLSCTLPMAEGAREVLLGVDTLAAFYQQAGYLGVTVGRFANRINNAQFSLHGKDYSISKNQGVHCLHGGVEGFNRRRWTLVEWSDRYVVYGLRSPDGDQGFPGQLDVTVRYELTQANGVEKRVVLILGSKSPFAKIFSKMSSSNWWVATIMPICLISQANALTW